MPPSNTPAQSAKDCRNHYICPGYGDGFVVPKGDSGLSAGGEKQAGCHEYHRGAG